jgi:hypothetical protein
VCPEQRCSLFNAYQKLSLRRGRFCLFHLHRQVGAYEDGTECSETSAYKIQTPGNYAEESTQRKIFTLKKIEIFLIAP